MENASKALIIAGSALLAVVLISLGIALWMNFSSYSKDNAQKRWADQMNQYSVKFEKYDFNKTSKYITAQDVRTLINLVNDYNDRFGEAGVEITVTTSGISGNITEWSEEEWIAFLEAGNNMGYSNNYAYKAETSRESNDIVTSVKISKK